MAGPGTRFDVCCFWGVERRSVVEVLLGRVGALSVLVLLEVYCGCDDEG